MTGRPHLLIARPESGAMSANGPSGWAIGSPCFVNTRGGALRMDPLSDVLRAVRLNGAYFYLVEASAPWSVSARPARELGPLILPDVEHLISYHILLTGSCWAGVEGDGQVQMK